MKKFYQVIKGGEIIATRKSERDYSHAVIFYHNKRWVNQELVEVSEFPSTSTCFARTKELAEKTAAAEAGRRGACRFEILPVVVKS